MIAIPQVVDRFGNAAMLEDLGAARTIATEDVTRDGLVALTTSDDVAARSAEQRDSVRREGDAVAAADVVESEPAR